MKTIPLTKGYVTFVDDDDYERVASFSWIVDERPRVNREPKRYAFTSRSIKGKTHNTYLHRFLMNATKGQVVDHVNGDGLDNRKQNLRLCTHSQNHANCPKVMTDRYGRGSRYKGVCRMKGRRFWYAFIRQNGRHVWLGSFESEEEAARAYDKRALELHGDFASLNGV